MRLPALPSQRAPPLPLTAAPPWFCPLLAPAAINPKHLSLLERMLGLQKNYVPAAAAESDESEGSPRKPVKPAEAELVTAIPPPVA